MMPPLIYAMLGTSVHASVGTGGLISLLTGETLASEGDLDERTRKATLLSLLVGTIITMMGVFRLAFLVRFLSQPALSGFITGSALLIILSQAKPMLGLPKEEAHSSWTTLLFWHPEYLSHVNCAELGIGLVALVFLLNVGRLKGVRYLEYMSKFKELFLLAVSAVFCARWNPNAPEDDRIPVIGAVPQGLPSFEFPISSWQHIADAKELLPGATLIALVSFLSSFAAAKKFAMKDGYEVRASNELLALGLANAGGATMGAVPVQIGLSRSGLAYQAGVKSQLGANIFVAVIVALVVVLLSPALYNVPLCVLNAIIINAATHLQEVHVLKELASFAGESEFSWKVRMEVVVWIAGFFCTIFLGAFSGMLCAVGISLALILNQVSNPDIHVLGFKESGEMANSRDSENASSLPTLADRKWMALQCHQDEQLHVEPGIMVFRLDGPLFYANVEFLQEWLDQQELKMAREGNDCVSIIMNAQSVPFVDTSAIHTLVSLINSYKERNILFFVANTFGQTGRLITSKVEDHCESMVFPQHVARAKACRTVDDFVQLTKLHRKAVSETTCRRSRSLKHWPAGCVGGEH
eukprot:TRINITY_DN45636_c0_g1_i1.p1 TRINITY_DN45636_c0_g1~~TRINITY_DN45636_c0_g1_i1.p1  ORF type:complete len:591 (-),score=101.75 TRINITY_DN45636_c0_g1_i1:12-1757(-)